MAAETGWQQKIGTFRIGLVGDPSTGKTIPGLSLLKKAYTLALGVPVEFFVASNFRELIEAQSSGRVDYAVYSATAYAAASLSCDCVEPLVAPTGADGAVGVRSVLIARDAGFQNLAEVTKYRVAISAPDDVTGFVLPASALAESGVVVSATSTFLVRASNAEEAEKLFVDGAVDGLFGWIETGVGKTPLPGSGTAARLSAAGIAPSALNIAWTSDLLRYGPHALRKGLDGEVRRRLLPFLTNLKATDPDIFDLLEQHHSGGFVRVDEDDYETAADIVRQMPTLAR